jgi:hypothetical protein
VYDNTIIVYYAILTMILDDTINHEKIACKKRLLLQVKIPFRNIFMTQLYTC